jgi:hypothetical protein
LGESQDRHGRFSTEIFECCQRSEKALVAAAEYFGLNPSPKSGGSSDKKRWLYRFWPGKPAPGWELI